MFWILLKFLLHPFRYRTENKDIDYTINVTKKAVDSWYDKDVIEKIITNLLSNAVKYTPAGGKIECSAFVKGSYTVYRDKKHRSRAF